MTSRALDLRHRTIASLCLHKLRDAGLAAGLDPRKIPAIEGSSLDAIRFDARHPYEAQLELWEALMRATDDPGFPIFVGSRTQPKDYDVLGFAYMTRANLREALDQAVRYSHVWSDASGWEVQSDEVTLTLTFLIDDPDRLGVRCETEGIFAEMVHSARSLTGVAFDPIEVRFRHRAPRETGAIEAFFQAPVRFGAPRSELLFDAARLATPLLKADPDLAAFFQRSADDLLERCATEGLARRLRALLEGELGRALPTLEAAAARLGVSARTLRRRLQEEGTTFQDVLDETRCELAKRHLVEDRLALGEVAFLLGFSEPSAFHRAFKRWTGQTPLAYRRLPAA